MNLKNIPNFPHYCATKNGRIWSKYRRRFITPYDSGKSGMLVVLCEQKRKFRKAVHRLVLETFVGPCPEGMVGCHNDGNFMDNNLRNLRWDTLSNNELDKHKHGTVNSKLSCSDARFIIYLRRCVRLKYCEIAEIMECSMNIVNHIINKRRWRHIWRESE